MSDQERTKPKKVKRRSYGDGGIDERGENTFRLRYRIGEKQDRKQYSKTSTALLTKPEKN